MTTMRDVELFTEITGDKNPIHYDAELAEKSPFGGLIVQGGVTTGLLNAVVAEDLPGPGTVFLETNWRFVKAVRVGETITASVKVEEIRDDKPICRLETIVRNENGETCVVGTATTYTMPLLSPDTDRTTNRFRLGPEAHSLNAPGLSIPIPSVTSRPGAGAGWAGERATLLER